MVLSKIRSKSKNTKIELIVRSRLHQRGYRFRLHKKDLPGKPDLFLPKYSAAIFTHGCFWHLHGCKLTKIPKTRTEFWQNKLLENKDRDQRNKDRLINLGFRVLTIWECALRDKSAEDIDDVFEKVVKWLEGKSVFYQIGEESGFILAIE